MINRVAYFLRSLFKKNLKIGIISVGYPKDNEKANSGGAIYPFYLSRGLAKLGCDVHVFFKSSGKYRKTRYIGDGRIVMHGIRVKMNVPVKDNLISNHLSNLIFDNKLIEEITKENKKGEFDIVNSNGGLTGGAFISKYFNNIRWINTIHLLEKNRQKFFTPEQKKYLKIFNWIESTIISADALIAVSKTVREEIVKTYGIKKEKVFFIPNGVDLEIFNDSELHKDKRVLYVGRFSLEKGIDLIPKIVTNVLNKNRDAIFEVVAADKNVVVPDSLESTRKQMEVLEKAFPNRFIWHREKLGREELSEIYKRAMIYIQPSRYDTYPTTVLEAMACGCLVICSKRGGMPEMVKNAGLVGPLNTTYFSRRILKLLEDYRLRERYVRRGIEISKEHGWEKISEKVFELFKILSRYKEKDVKSTEEAFKTLENLYEEDKNIKKGADKLILKNG
jgi:glycosyltransferase involved in cell wall biosynthesis